MTGLRCVIVSGIGAVAATLFVFAGSPGSASDKWFLMSRHGECHEIHVLKRKVQDLGDIRDPYAFVKLMRDKGHQVLMNERTMPNSKSVEVSVPERNLRLIFVTAGLCQAQPPR